jgi:hypothetical protein
VGILNLTNFSRARINDSKNFIDISNGGKAHISQCVILTAYEFASEVIEVRRKERQVAMFTLEFDDIEIPDYWKDAEVMFTNRK